MDKLYRPVPEFLHMIRTDGVGASVIFRVAPNPKKGPQAVGAGQQGHRVSAGEGR